jgi:hypothetical protein
LLERPGVAPFAQARFPRTPQRKKNNGVGQLHSISSAFGLTTKLKKQLVSSLMHLNPDSCKRQPPPEWFYRQGLLPDYRPL